ESVALTPESWARDVAAATRRDGGSGTALALADAPPGGPSPRTGQALTRSWSKRCARTRVGEKSHASTRTRRHIHLRHGSPSNNSARRTCADVGGAEHPVARCTRRIY